MAYVKKRPALDPCPVEVVFAIVCGKWKARILRNLFDGPQSFGHLKRALGQGLTQQVLSTQLRELEQDGMVIRTPTGTAANPGTRYSLTEEALTLLPALDAAARWGLARLAREGKEPAPAQLPIHHPETDGPGAPGSAMVPTRS